MRHIRAVNSKARRIEAYLSDGSYGLAAGVAGTDGLTGPGAIGAAVPGTTCEAAAELPPGHDVVGLESRTGPWIPLGCTFLFSPGWEVDSQGRTAGLCQPVERDLFDCHLGCFWPAQVPDQLNHAPDWTGKCAAAQKDWRKIDLIFP